MATHSSVLAWRIPGTEEPGGLPSMGSHRVGHDWSDLSCMHAYRTHTHTHTRACTVLTSFFSVISWLLHKHHVSCLFAPVFYSDHLSPYLSLFPLLLFFCYSPLLLNLLITRLDIEVRILLCFSWLLTLYIRFCNPRHPCNQGALSLYWVNGSLSHVDRDY